MLRMSTFPQTQPPHAVWYFHTLAAKAGISPHFLPLPQTLARTTPSHPLSLNLRRATHSYHCLQHGHVGNAKATADTGSSTREGRVSTTEQDAFASVYRRGMSSRNAIYK